MSRRIALLAAALVAAAGFAATVALAAPAHRSSAHLLVGINDEADTLYGNPAVAFAQLKSLNTQVLRVNMYWGGTPWAVANKKPSDPTDPGDPSYNWSLYDRLVQYAAKYKIKVVFSILFTPSWANGGKPRNSPPTNFADLQKFAYAAAERYGGLFTPPQWQANASLGIGNGPLPKVTMWTAWNEPNNPSFLAPQYKRVGGSWVVWSAKMYAQICNAIYNGIHAPALAISGEQVACGVTAPKGNDAPATPRASVDPLTFLGQSKKFGMKRFDVYAHHPYADAGSEGPSYVPTGKHARRVQLGNIGLLLSEITSLYGPKHLWITEYGYQTNPPDTTIFGISWATQAADMRQAYAIARANPRIDMLLWFLIKDEGNISGWQSGLATVSGRHKPSWNVFKSLPRG
ncbi:MAG TPA: hypothetical protein VFM96_00750 [Gaiellaceae bacterium]|nr:hypothetical protein [Gaiellaceae bacterium]